MSRRMHRAKRRKQVLRRTVGDPRDRLAGRQASQQLDCRQVLFGFTGIGSHRSIKSASQPEEVVGRRWRKGGHTTTPLIVPSAKFQKNRCLALLSQGLQRLKSCQRFANVFANVFGFLGLVLHLFTISANIVFVKEEVFSWQLAKIRSD